MFKSLLVFKSAFYDRVSQRCWCLSGTAWRTNLCKQRIPEWILCISPLSSRLAAQPHPILRFGPNSPDKRQNFTKFTEGVYTAQSIFSLLDINSYPVRVPQVVFSLISDEHGKSQQFRGVQVGLVSNAKGFDKLGITKIPLWREHQIW